MFVSTTLTIFLSVVAGVKATSNAPTATAQASSNTPQGPSPAAVTSYKSIFNEIRAIAIPPRPQIPDANCCHSGCCALCCNFGALISHITADASGVVSAGPPAVTAAITVSVGNDGTLAIPAVKTVTEPPSHTTISPQVAEAAAAAAAAADVNPDNQHILANIQAKILNKVLPVAQNEETDGHPESAKDDITTSFYTLPLSGQHPAVIPVVIEDAHTHEPLTLLAFANPGLTSNYISSTLVHHLNYTSAATTPQDADDKDDETSLPLLPGALTPTSVTLPLLAGSQTRRFPLTAFRIFHPYEPESGVDGAWQPDLILGLAFLRAANALRLTEEFNAPPPAALGVVVQRVVAVGADGVDVGHTEL